MASSGGPIICAVYLLVLLMKSVPFITKINTTLTSTLLLAYLSVTTNVTQTVRRTVNKVSSGAHELSVEVLIVHTAQISIVN